MKKEYLATIGITLLSVAFVTVSLLLYFNKNSRWLTARKIKLGAIMLTLTAVISSCSGRVSEDDDIIMCYSVCEDTTLYEEDTIEYINENDTIETVYLEVLDTAEFE